MENFRGDLEANDGVEWRGVGSILVVIDAVTEHFTQLF